MVKDFYEGKRESWLQRAEQFSELTEKQQAAEAAALKEDIKKNPVVRRRMEREWERPGRKDPRLAKFFALTQPGISTS